MYKRQFQYGSDVPYATIHEFGQGRVPARPVVGLLAENVIFEEGLARDTDDWLQNRFVVAGYTRRSGVRVRAHSRRRRRR